MRRRLYFVLPDIRSAKIVHNELLLARIEERHIHVVAKDGVSLDDLPEADIRQKSDLVHGIQMGFMIGGLTGIFLSVMAIMLDMIVTGLEAWSVASLVFGGAIFGAFASSLIAVNVRNSRLKQFESEIDDGQLLFIVDVPVYRLEEIRNLVHGHHPEAHMHGIDPQVPAFP